MSALRLCPSCAEPWPRAAVRCPWCRATVDMPSRVPEHLFTAPGPKTGQTDRPTRSPTIGQITR